MNRHVRALALILAVQLAVLGGVLFWNQRAASTPAGTLLAIDRTKVDGLVIVDEKGARLKLQRTDAGWTLPDSQGLPVDGEKVSQFLDKLIAASAPWPVATSSESAKRFEVAADKFQREIQLLEDDKVVGDLYFGTSPGFKKVHARNAESDDIYAVAFANYEATAHADDWLDKALLKPNGDVTALSRPDHWRVQRDGEVWSLDGIARGETTKQDVVGDLVNKVVNLRVMGAAEVPATDAEPVLLLTARTANGEFDYRFYQPQPKSDFIVTRNGQDGAFKVAAYVAEPLIKDRADLVSDGSAPTPTPAAMPAPSASPLTKPAAKPQAESTGT
jgi:Domain of unknown function (DUF4340)